jgi:hypothetical protein
MRFESQDDEILPARLCDTVGGGHALGMLCAVLVDHSHPVVLHGGEICAAHDQGHVMTLPRQMDSHQPADAACPYYAHSHRLCPRPILSAGI